MIIGSILDILACAYIIFSEYTKKLALSPPGIDQSQIVHTMIKESSTHEARVTDMTEQTPPRKESIIPEIFVHKDEPEQPESENNPMIMKEMGEIMEAAATTDEPIESKQFMNSNSRPRLSARHSIGVIRTSRLQIPQSTKNLGRCQSLDTSYKGEVSTLSIPTIPCIDEELKTFRRRQSLQEDVLPSHSVRVAQTGDQLEISPRTRRLVFQDKYDQKMMVALHHEEDEEKEH